MLRLQPVQAKSTITWLESEKRQLRSQLSCVELERDTIKATLETTNSQLQATDALLAAAKAILSEESRRRDPVYQRLSDQLEQRNCQPEPKSLADDHRSTDDHRSSSRPKKDLASDYVAKMEGLSELEAKVHRLRKEFEHGLIRDKNAHIDLEKRARVQTAELLVVKHQLEETTSALQATEQRNESLITTIEEVQSMCSYLSLSEIATQ